jgi:ankyrin repeat protein
LALRRLTTVSSLGSMVKLPTSCHDSSMNMHEFLDSHYGPDGDAQLRQRITEGADLEARLGPLAETALHVATRRRRLSAIEILIDHGADIDARTSTGKTSYAHATRRGFQEVSDLLAKNGADVALALADQFAVAVGKQDFEAAQRILGIDPLVIRTSNPEEDRLLADMAGRNETSTVEFLIAAGADLTATALDDGTPLHQAAWFGQPENVQRLIEAGAPLDVFDRVHGFSPLGWGAHGSRYSGGADKRQAEYLRLVEMLLHAGSSLAYPHEPGPRYRDDLVSVASQPIAELIGRFTP